ncbi:hypothetical protein Acr_00g0002270 [Actinidia rufa]|uniref:G-patch domain-containing protein n=1 Tax=Actinidia rufa TaxID=165716 RepID=A0A7J0D7H7_9ERIC|nr:hypothetical protein Acr_00g0002270 [Actinidia rufa]
MLPRTIDAKAVWFNQEEKCDFHLGAIGHRTDRCLGLRHRIQDLIDSGVIKFNFDHGIVSYDLCNIEQHQLRPKQLSTAFRKCQLGNPLSFPPTVAAVTSHLQPMVIKRPFPAITVSANADEAVTGTEVAEIGKMTRSGRSYTPEELELRRRKAKGKETEPAEVDRQNATPTEPAISGSSHMIAKVLRENGFQPDKGMGTDLQGRLNPIELPKADHTFGIGFTPTRRDRQKAIEDHRRKSLDEYSNQSGSIPLSKVYEVIKPIPPMMSLNPPTSKGAIHKRSARSLLL